MTSAFALRSALVLTSAFALRSALAWRRAAYVCHDWHLLNNSVWHRHFNALLLDTGYVDSADVGNFFIHDSFFIDNLGYFLVHCYIFLNDLLNCLVTWHYDVHRNFDWNLNWNVNGHTVLNVVRLLLNHFIGYDLLLVHGNWYWLIIINGSLTGNRYLFSNAAINTACLNLFDCFLANNSWGIKAPRIAAKEIISLAFAIL